MSVDVPPERGADVHSLVRLPPAWAAAEPQGWFALRAGLFSLLATAALDAFSHTLPPGYQLLWAVETSFMLAAGAIALWLGDRPARLIGPALILSEIAQTFLQSLGAGYRSTTFTLAKHSHLLIGVAFLLTLIAVALRWPRPWLLAACAFQLALVATFVAAMLDLSIRPLAFVTAANTWMLLGGVALLWGAFSARAHCIDAAAQASRPGRLAGAGLAPTRNAGVL
ncbi:hypothetical protein [Caulobacter sp. 17J80-11]|uniref:hypothetical protein n=1 Tax=Caulobacter sp. 17J80-11 TaxID=2763502 RepID=UPI001653D5C9|nr:hypothetical protein [Caulobacter sp. 17J80-11]MBC6980168.1 hypothetical protein [Caulobacter sp. 17J80-11]